MSSNKQQDAVEGQSILSSFKIRHSQSIAIPPDVMYVLSKLGRKAPQQQFLKMTTHWTKSVQTFPQLSDQITLCLPKEQTILTPHSDQNLRK